MKKLILIIFCLLAVAEIRPQGIGEMAPEKESMIFPPNAWGVDIMFGEGGFGFGAFYRKDLKSDFTFFTDFSFSEAKDEKEFEYIDYWGNSYVNGKKNRVFLLPLNFGLQYRLFKNEIGDNLRPYINIGAGPSVVVTTPYKEEFFTSFGKAQAHYTAGAYIGIGANFGLDQSRLLGINIRYYVIRFFNEGIEGLEGSFMKNLGGFYVTINLGSMY